jgi:hypothetical protein
MTPWLIAAHDAIETGAKKLSTLKRLTWSRRGNGITRGKSLCNRVARKHRRGLSISNKRRKGCARCSRDERRCNSIGARQCLSDLRNCCESGSCNLSSRNLLGNGGCQLGSDKRRCRLSCGDRGGQLGRSQRGCWLSRGNRWCQLCGDQSGSWLSRGNRGSELGRNESRDDRCWSRLC